MESNKARITNYKLVYRVDYGDGDDEVDTYVQYFDSENALLCTVSKLYAFDDCCPVEVLEIVSDGRELRYCGWRPGMEYSYYDKETKEVVWTEYFDEWDH